MTRRRSAARNRPHGRVFRPTDRTDFSGPDTFAPPAPASANSVALSTFDGADPHGTWQLFVVDDAASCQLEFASGAVGVLNASGLCLGRTNHQRVEVYGMRGGIVYEIDWPGDAGDDRLHVCFGAAQHRTVAMAPAPTLPRHEATPLDPFLDFFQAIHDGRDALVTFDDAVRVQAVLEAAERSAASGGGWVDLPTDD